MIRFSFDQSCKYAASNDKVLADLEKLAERLKKQYNNSAAPFEKPLVVSVEYVGDNDLEKLANQYYTKDELTRFSAIFSSLDKKIQKEYCTKMIADGKIAFLSSSAEHMKSDLIDYCLEMTYKKGNIALFSAIVPDLTDEQKELWVARASRDNKNTFLAVLTR